MRILFPCEYDNLKNVDDNYQREYNACQTLNIDTLMFDHDLFVNNNKFKFNFKPSETKVNVVMRSWMLNKKQYIKLYYKLLEMNYVLINNPNEYIHCHYFQNVYENIKEYTPKIHSWFHLNNMTKRFLQFIVETQTTDLLMKDFVKSANDNIVKLGTSSIELKNQIERFVEERQPLFNEGIILKEFINLKRYGERTNEWRVFVLNGQMISMEPNSNQLGDENKPIISEDFSKIESNFFTLDFAEDINGNWIILEAGDGQVSGISFKQNEFEFLNKF